jgi:hypothetical protein
MSRSACLCVVSVLCLILTAQAAEFHWKANTSGSWSVLGNWLTLSGGNLIPALGLPLLTDSIFFDQSGTYTVTFDGSILTYPQITVGGSASGTVTFQIGKTYQVGSQGMRILANGVVKVVEGGSIAGSSKVEVAANGKLLLEGGSVALASQASFVVNGTLEMAGTVNSTIFNSISFGVGSAMTVGKGAGCFLNSGANIVGSASINLDASIYASNQNSKITTSGAITVNPGTATRALIQCALTTSGNVIVSTGDFILAAATKFEGAASMTVATAASVYFDSNVEYSASGSVSGNGNVYSKGIFQTDSSSNTVSILAAFENRGTFRATGSGKTIISSSFSQKTNGTYFTTNSNVEVQANSALTINNGTINGNGNITASTVTCGSIFNAGNSPGTAFVNGNLVLDSDSVLLVEIEGTSNSEYDRIFASGRITVNGFIQFHCQGSYTCTTGHSFTFLRYTSVTWNLR